MNCAFNMLPKFISRTKSGSLCFGLKLDLVKSQFSAAEERMLNDLDGQQRL